MPYFHKIEKEQIVQAILGERDCLSSFVTKSRGEIKDTGRGNLSPLRRSLRPSTSPYFSTLFSSQTAGEASGVMESLLGLSSFLTSSE